MGISHSYFSIIGSQISNKEITETHTDGTIVTTRSNPYVNVAIIGSVTIVMWKYLDRRAT